MMSVEQAWEHLLQKNVETKEAVEQLKKAIKDERTQHIQEFIQSEEFASATQILEDLNVFTKVKYQSNLSEIEKALRSVMDKDYTAPPQEEIIEEPVQVMQENKERPTAPAVVQEEVAIAVETRKLTLQEEEVIRTIGYGGISRVKDGKNVDQVTVNSLLQKGYLNPGATKQSATFELSETGKQQFQELEGIEASPSFLQEMLRKDKNLDQAYFIYDLENVLQERQFKIENFEGNNIDLSRDNFYYYLNLNQGDLTPTDFVSILEEKHRLKSIGFICINEDVLQETKKQVNDWVANNKTKCRYMTIHYATILRLENSEEQNVFETVEL